MGHQRENTPSGSEVPSLLPSPPSNPCGSPRPTTMKPVHLSSTENASKFSHCTRSFFFALDLAFQPFNNLFSSSIFLILSLSFLYHTSLSYSKGSKSLSNAHRDRTKRFTLGVVAGNWSGN